MNNLSHRPEAESVLLMPMDKAALETFLAESDTFTRNFVNSNNFKGTYGSCQLIFDQNGNPDRALVGVDSPPNDPRNTVLLFARIAAAVPAGKNYHLEPQAWGKLDWEQAAIGWLLQGYRYREFVKKEEAAASTLTLPESVNLNEAKALAEGMFLARDLINAPASSLGTKELIEKARTIAAEFSAEFSVIEGEELLAHNYPSIYTVGKGSERPPALIDLRWGDASHPRVTLVGKGVVFDTGGLNLKGAANMLLMKKDMGGAGVTLALAQTIMKCNLPIRLRLLIPTVENTPGSRAYRPGDVIQTRKGLSVEIGNTDAEGRVILSDALVEATSEKVDLVIDMATLTGACRVALGEDLPGFWTPSDDLAEQLTRAGNRTADPVWRMPLWAPYRKSLDSTIADMNNMSSNPFGGAITAALFLHEFVKPMENWIHVDMYGWRGSAGADGQKGGEATALRAVYRFLADRYPR